MIAVPEKITKDIQKQIDRGLGQGAGTNYQPWLKTYKVSSKGLVSRIHGWKSGREHHLMSNLETGYFLLLEWSDVVIDIREQFPLLPIEETLAIAEELGIKHPTAPKTGLPVVMTTDFRITLRKGAQVYDECRAVKYSSSLENKRVQEKLEIERRYWANHNIPFKIVTEKEIPESVVENIRWLHEWREPDKLCIDGKTLQHVSDLLLKEILSVPTMPLAHVASKIDGRLGLPSGASLGVVRHCLALKLWDVDITVPINPDRPLELKGVSAIEFGQVVGMS